MGNARVVVVDHGTIINVIVAGSHIYVIPHLNASLLPIGRLLYGECVRVP